MGRATQLAGVGALLVAMALLALTLRAVLRRRPNLASRRLLVTGLAGTLLAAGAVLVERWSRGLVGRAAGEAVPLYVALGMWGPLEEGLKVGALWPAFARRELRGPLEAMALSAMVSAPFVILEGVERLSHPNDSPGLLAATIVLTAPLHLLGSLPWAYTLGTSFPRSNPRPSFLPAWIAAVVLRGLSAYLLALGTPKALLATVPIALGLASFVVLTRGQLRPVDAPRRTAPRRVRAPLTMQEVRERLARRAAPLSVRWVLFGALVNQGALVLMLVAAVVVGNRFGVDFPAIDATSRASLGPLGYLVTAALSSFPLAGFLIARSSALPTLLEPALAALLSLLVVAVVVGATAPIALAALLAITPIALGLCCAGAWLGLR